MEPVRLRRARSHLARGLGRGYGTSRGRGRCATRVEGALGGRGGGRRALVGVEGDPMGPHGEREASSSFVEFHEARQICRVRRPRIRN